MAVDNRVEDFDAIAKRLQAEIEANGGAVSYKVSVVKIEQGVAEKQGDYGVMCEVEGEGKAYGYPPSRPETFKRETELFTQRVIELNLPEVVKAVNGLK
jgi:hypothetical protein